MSNPNVINEQLYTARGSQSVIVGHSLKKFLSLANFEDFIIQFPEHRYAVVKALEYVSVYPGYHGLSRNFLHNKQYELAMSSTSLLRWQNEKAASIEDLAHQRRSGMLIKVWPNVTTTSKGFADMQQYIHEFGADSFNYFDFMEVTASINGIMDIVFSATTYICLFLCLFSVISSMYINIYEQSKEVAVLRAIGLSKYETYKVYLYEAIVLILSSCIMGVGIGALIGFTMTAQIALYASYPITFDMSYHLLVIILIASFVSAAISVIVPLIQLLPKTVSQVIRVNFK